MNRRTLRVLTALAGLVVLHQPARTDEQIRLVATADVWLSASRAEGKWSMGRATRLKLKSIQEMALLDFDLRPLGERPIVSAELFVRSDPDSVRREQKRLGLGEVFPLRVIGVSTVSSAWSEGNGRQAGPDPTGQGATFESPGGGRDWAWPASTLCDVIFGNGNSLWRRAELERVGADGWWKVPVEPALLAALRGGGGHGLCITDESTGPGGHAANNYVFSREQPGSEPYLLVTVGPQPNRQPAAAPAVAAAPDPDAASLTRGAVRLTIADPPAWDAWRLRIDSRAVEPWQVRPSVSPNGLELVVTDLAPDREATIELTPVSATRTYQPARVTARTSKALPTPGELAAFRPPPPDPPAEKGWRATVVPELVKVDPFGRLLEQVAPKAAWGTSIELPAARGQIAACQLLLDASAENPGQVAVAVGDFVAPGGAKIASTGNVRLFRVWYVKAGDVWQPELAVPLAGPVAIPDPANGIAGQTHQLVWLDLSIPALTPPGSYVSKVIASAGRSTRELTLRVKVHEATIPAEIGFSPELNMYGPPAPPGSESYYEAHRLAHYHRAVINVVPYTQSRRVHAGYSPALAGSGGEVRVADWSSFDRAHGPLLDGSAFAGNPRGAVPVAAFYLPLYECWPVPFLDNYAFNKPAEDASIPLHHLSRRAGIKQAVSPAFQNAWANVVADLHSHFQARGWTKTVFQCYLNNKFWKSRTMFWNLDEPACREDFLALRFFGELFRAGGAKASPGDSKVKLSYRGDISRPQWQFGDLAGVINVEYVGSDVFNMPRTVREVTRRTGSVFHVYGACNPVDRSNLESVAWCLKSFLVGGEGVLPWQSLDREGKAFTAADVNGLIVWGKPAGYDGWAASLRVFALRRGAQDVELLRLFGQQKGFNREQLGAVVGRYVPLGIHVNQRPVDEASPVRFDSLSADGLTELEAGLLAAIPPKKR